MASRSPVTELQEVRNLAQKLFSQCRDSPSSYKLLATSVRKLRNGLEEVEEIFDDTRTLGPDDYKLLEQVAQSRELLERLDLSLQSYRCSKQKDVNESAVADFKTALDVLGHQLSLAFEAISTGEIELRLDTSIVAEIIASKSPSTNFQSASSSSRVDSVHERKSTPTSSTWSLAPHDSPGKVSSPEAPTLRLDTTTEATASEGKEVYDPVARRWQSNAASSGATTSRASLDWRSPFASPDPLSTSIEEATSLILGNDEPLTPNPARPRSITGPPAIPNAQKEHNATSSETQTGVVAPTTIEQDELHGRAQSDSNRPRGYSDSPQQLGRKPAVRIFDSNGLGIRTSRSHESLASDTSRQLSDASSDIGAHLSPKTASAEFGKRSRNNSAPSITFSVRSVETGEQKDSLLQKDSLSHHEDILTTQDQVSVAEPATDVDESPSSWTQDVLNQVDEEISRTGKGPPTGLNIVIDTVDDEIANEAVGKPLPPSPAFDSVEFSPNTPQEENDTPPLPDRKPPPPPPSPKKSKPKKPRNSGSYIIVNADVTDSPSSDDDEDLYSSSRPTSPTEASKATEVHPEEQSIPRVTVDTSAIEEPTGLPQHRRASKGHEWRRRMLETRANMEPSSGATDSKHVPSSKSSTLTLSIDNIIKEDEELVPKRHSTSELPPAYMREKVEEKDIHAEKTPQVPPRPPARRSRYRSKSHTQGQSDQPAPAKPTPAKSRTSPAAIPPEPAGSIEKELAVESGLEVEKSGLEVRTEDKSKVQYPKWINRIAIDAAMNIRTPSVSTRSSETTRDNEGTPRSAVAPQVNNAADDSQSQRLTGWYAPGTDDTSVTDLDQERVDHILHFWNTYQWDQAELYLMAYLESLVEQDSLARARRIRHLLGVCNSLKGQWDRAIPLFLSVLRTPIKNIEEIDDGDCSAAYWLGDAYSIQNKRTEALLAYCVAERSSLFGDESDLGLSDLISLEQQAVQLGLSKADYKVRWAEAALNTSGGASKSILDTKVITTSMAKTLLENEPRKTRKDNSTFQLEQIRSRSSSLFWLAKSASTTQYHRMKLTKAHFEPDTTWPMMYDPLFCMANVQRGRLLAYECDLVTLFNSNSEARIPKSGPMGLSRIDCFTCTDLNWLLLTVRQCLEVLGMEFSEVANVEGTWFVIRYTHMQMRIATSHYFSIALFKQSFRSGYGVEICPDGICSARIIQSDYEHEKGVHQSEGKRIKKLIREYLDEQLKQQVKQRPKVKKKDSFSASFKGISNARASEDEVAPQLPPRPTEP